MWITGLRRRGAPCGQRRANPQSAFLALPRAQKCRTLRVRHFRSGAVDEIRTRDIHLGKVVLYQLSYNRNTFFEIASEENEFLHSSVGDTGIEPVTSSVSGKRATAAPIAQILIIQ